MCGCRHRRQRFWQAHLGEDGPEGGAGGESVPDPDSTGAVEGADGRMVATRTDTLRKRDLRGLLDEDTLRAAEQAARDLARAIRDRRSCPRRQARRGARLDLGRSLRASLARGGELLDLFRWPRPERPMRIVAICAVSGSTQTVSRVFLAFLMGRRSYG